MADEDARKRLREAGELIRHRAKDIASEFSTRIPASLEISEGDNEVVIRANPEIAPHARAFELGKRHPLNYPNQREAKKGQPWGRTPHKPFLERAVDEQEGKAVERVAMVIDDWTHKLGYK